jgi:hypothetical protein
MSLGGCRNHAEKDDLALISLECIRVTAYKLPPLHFFRAEFLEKQSFYHTSLGVPQKTDNSDRHPIVAAIRTDIDDLLDQGLGFRWVDDSRRSSLLIPVFDVAGDNYGREAPSAILSERDQRLGSVTQVIRKLNDFGHAPEVLAESNSASVTDFGLVKEAVIDAESVRMREVMDVAFF